MGIKKTLLKNSYIACKGALCGLPVGVICFKTAKQCVKDLVMEDFLSTSTACKGILLCFPPLGTVALIGAFGTPEGMRKIKTGTKLAFNIIAVPFTGPAFFVDNIMGSLEEVAFGEALPILKGADGLFLLK